MVDLIPSGKVARCDFAPDPTLEDRILAGTLRACRDRRSTERMIAAFEAQRASSRAGRETLDRILAALRARQESGPEAKAVTVIGTVGGGP